MPTSGRPRICQADPTTVGTRSALDGDSSGSSDRSWLVRGLPPWEHTSVLSGVVCMKRCPRCEQEIPASSSTCGHCDALPAVPALNKEHTAAPVGLAAAQPVTPTMAPAVAAVAAAAPAVTPATPVVAAAPVVAPAKPLVAAAPVVAPAKPLVAAAHVASSKTGCPANRRRRRTSGCGRRAGVSSGRVRGRGVRSGRLESPHAPRRSPRRRRRHSDVRHVEVLGSCGASDHRRAPAAPRPAKPAAPKSAPAAAPVSAPAAAPAASPVVAPVTTRTRSQPHP